MFSHVTLGCSDIGLRPAFLMRCSFRLGLCPACGAGWRSRSRMLDQTGGNLATVLCVHAV